MSDEERTLRELGRHRARLPPSLQSEVHKRMLAVLGDIRDADPKCVRKWAATLSATPQLKRQVEAWRNAGTLAASDKIEVLAGLLDQVRAHIDKMPRDALAAIDAAIEVRDAKTRSSLQRLLRSTGSQEVDRILERRRTVRPGLLAERHIPKLMEVCGLAKRHLVENPTEVTGGRKKLQAAFVAGLAAQAFRELTGRPANRSINRGSFVEFLEKVFEVLDIDASASKQARSLPVSLRRL